MTRNLIEAQAWENGRREICEQCQHSRGPGGDTPEYDWQKCLKRQIRDESSAWEAGSCRLFEPRQDDSRPDQDSAV
jgi:hypothetical protein